MNISFSEKQAQYISAKVGSGEYKDASEVVQDALSLHERYRKQALEELRNEIAKGWDGATSKRSVKDIIEAKSKGA